MEVFLLILVLCLQLFLGRSYHSALRPWLLSWMLGVRRVDGRWLCRGHAARALQNTKHMHAAVPLPQFRDDVVATSDVGRIRVEEEGGHVCKKCGSCNFPGEAIGTGATLHYAICCHNGKTKNLPDFPEAPPVLKRLLTDGRRDARSFREQIRQYNASLAFVSFGATIAVPPGKGVPVFRIHGGVYHASGALRPPEGDAPSYAQLYVWDPQEALEERLRRNPKAEQATMAALRDELVAMSPFAEAYRMMDEVVRQEAETAGARGEPSRDVKMVFANKSHLDKRRYNTPTHNEVAMVFVGDARRRFERARSVAVVASRACGRSASVVVE